MDLLLNIRTGLLAAGLMALLNIPFFQPEAQAMDPVTIAILTPIAIKGAQIAAPYVITGMRSGAAHTLSMGRDLIDIFRLPVGMLQSSVGIPFSQFSTGIRNIGRGTIAPFRLTVKLLLLPLAFCGIGVG